MYSRISAGGKANLALPNGKRLEAIFPLYAKRTGRLTSLFDASMSNTQHRHTAYPWYSSVSAPARSYWKNYDFLNTVIHYFH